MFRCIAGFKSWVESPQPTPLRDGVYRYLVEPYTEGTERINRAFSGTAESSIARPALPWKRRVISLITGILLVIPGINTIVWIAMRKFGNPDSLSDPPDVIPSSCTNTPVV